MLALLASLTHDTCFDSLAFGGVMSFGVVCPGRLLPVTTTPHEPAFQFLQLLQVLLEHVNLVAFDIVTDRLHSLKTFIVSTSTILAW